MNKSLWIVAAAIAAVGGLYFAFRPEAGPPPPSPQVSAAQQPTAGVALRQEFMLMVENGKLAAGPDRISVVQGTEVTIVVTSDQPDELHLHGYDRKVRLPAREPTSLAFLADRAGRFELELHGAHAGVAVVEVQPY